jgi:hypothetical protein
MSIRLQNALHSAERILRDREKSLALIKKNHTPRYTELDAFFVPLRSTIDAATTVLTNLWWGAHTSEAVDGPFRMGPGQREVEALREWERAIRGYEEVWKLERVAVGSGGGLEGAEWEGWLWALARFRRSIVGN